MLLLPPNASVFFFIQIKQIYHHSSQHACLFSGPSKLSAPFLSCTSGFPVLSSKPSLIPHTQERELRLLQPFLLQQDTAGSEGQSACYFTIKYLISFHLHIDLFLSVVLHVKFYSLDLS